MLRTTILAGASALALAACGQQATVETTEPTTVAEAPVAPATINDADFVQAVANSDAFEIQSADLAIAHAGREDVKAFARMMKTDHTATSAALAALAPTLSLTAPTPMIDTSHQGKLDALNGASGESFDDAYLDQQVEAHQTAVRLFEDYLAGAPQGPLQQWAASTLPTLRTHLQNVQSLENAT
jgi:putative membrane protein